MYTIGYKLGHVVPSIANGLAVAAKLLLQRSLKGLGWGIQIGVCLIVIAYFIR